MTMNKILILGGTGFVGRTLCERLLERPDGAELRLVVPSRHPERARTLQALPGVELVGADVHDAAALARLVAGSDAVINLVAILHGRPADFERVHVELPRRLAAACVRAGVRRMLHVSALGAAPQAPSHYLRTKAAGEAVLQASGLALTVLRPSVIFGADDRFLNLFATLQARLPLLPLAGADAQFQPVWVRDIADALVHCLDDAATTGLTLECAGPQVYTLAELARLAGRWSGHARPVLPVPDALARLQAALMELAPGEPLMSRDNLDSMQVPNVASGTLPGLAKIGITPNALEALGPALLSANTGCRRLDRLRRIAHHG